MYHTKFSKPSYKICSALDNNEYKLYLFDDSKNVQILYPLFKATKEKCNFSCFQVVVIWKNGSSSSHQSEIYTFRSFIVPLPTAPV